MTAERINRVSTTGLIVLSLTALLTVLSAALPIVISGRVPPPASDEGTAAHIFQLSIVALVPMGILFLATADWTRPSRNVRRLAFPTVVVVVAFGVLYYFEHLKP